MKKFALIAVLAAPILAGCGNSEGSTFVDTWCEGSDKVFIYSGTGIYVIPDHRGCERR
ncbi:hypothetical protein LZ318_11690 [Saccharopolyspora indica]|uniref:hypothetical protein n=1 Tax=Saccharopolyspora indica TaxID=1229659 RepID=UPI0022EA8354|nr:hypothetical protein [Saccharopolyspora indica]MDA3643827.1 hypothetical protein [Saccharopolyspora indica]